MSDLDLFRQDLAGLLARCATDRRLSLCGGVESGEDLKIIALFERLAREAATLDAAVIERGAHAANPGLDKRCFVPRREALLAQVGVLYWPGSAADLVQWMGAQVLEIDPPGGDGGRVPPADRPAARRPADAGPSPPRVGGTIKASAFPSSFANDFSAGFGIVAPLLSVWEIGQGIGQWRDHVRLGSRPAVPASVLSAMPSEGDRGASLSSDLLVSFKPSPSETACRVAVRIGPATVRPAAGATLMVVPRSFNCEPPLIASEIGSPMMTFALAAGLMAGGLVALRLWGSLATREPGQRATGMAPLRPRRTP